VFQDGSEQPQLSLTGTFFPAVLRLAGSNLLLHFTSDLIGETVGFELRVSTESGTGGCEGSGECSGHGTCTGGKCVYEAGYYGQTCAFPYCLASNPPFTAIQGYVQSNDPDFGYNVESSCELSFGRPPWTAPPRPPRPWACSCTWMSLTSSSSWTC